MKNLSTALAAPWDTASFSEADSGGFHRYLSQYAMQIGVHPLLFEYVLDRYVLCHTDASITLDLHMVLNADVVIDAYLPGASPLQFNAKRILAAVVCMQTVNAIAAVRLGCLYIFASAIVKGKTKQIAPFVSTGSKESAHFLADIVEKDLNALGMVLTTENVFVMLALAAYHNPTSSRLFSLNQHMALSISKPVSFVKHLLRQLRLEERIYIVVERLLDLFTDSTGNMSIRSVLHVLRCIDQYWSSICSSSLTIPAEMSGSDPIREQTESLETRDAREDDYIHGPTLNNSLTHWIHMFFVSSILCSQSSTDLATLRERLQTLNYSNRSVARIIQILLNGNATESQHTADQILNAHIVAANSMDE